MAGRLCEMENKIRESNLLLEQLRGSPGEEAKIRQVQRELDRWLYTYYKALKYKYPCEGAGSCGQAC